MGQEVVLMNPRGNRQRAACGTISGMSGEYKFHFKDIPNGFFKVDVREALLPNVALMVPNADAEQEKLKDVVGTSALWLEKCIRPAQ
jgi:hypothetical protein